MTVSGRGLSDADRLVVDAENCTRPMSPADLVMVNGEATSHELSLSYETCGNLNAYRCSVLR